MLSKSLWPFHKLTSFKAPCVKSCEAPVVRVDVNFGTFFKADQLSGEQQVHNFFVTNSTSDSLNARFLFLVMAGDWCEFISKIKDPF